MFRKILIANRGEIACRVIKTARRMGIATVAVYSDADRDAAHVELADESVNIGLAPARESYLMMENIFSACRQSGADAVHPGYGFLSENAEFARLIEERGVVFIGPKHESIAAMGDKIASKRLAIEAKVNTIPGHNAPIESAEQALEVAARVGYPVMIKASAGGGGKGLRVACDEKEAAEGFVSCRNEARTSFGDDRVFIEKFIEEPRHIEIQVLGDAHGHCVHLWERECSIQRRHQKVIEEAPSPFLNNEARAAMGTQAIALAKAVNYQSVGTVEFVVGKDRSFYFLEMNTRLQVEHPVTECITGLDLVEQMIRVAAGERLAFTQPQVRRRGWAIECRINAEDPFRNFLPSTGRLIRFKPPIVTMEAARPAPDREGVRIDTGVYEGGEISIHYDSMIAKVIAYAEDRGAAITLMRGALNAFVIRGISSNIAFQSALLGHPRFVEGRFSTAFIAEEYPKGFSAEAAPHDKPEFLLAVAAAAYRSTPEGSPESTKPVDLVVVLTDNSGHKTETPLTTRIDGGAIVVRIGVRDYPVTLRSPLRAVAIEGDVSGAPFCVQIERKSLDFLITHNGTQLKARVLPPRAAVLNKKMPFKAPPDLSKLLLAPMPGLLVSVVVQPGQHVHTGARLAVIEAMKMENVLLAARDGVVAEITASKGDTLTVDQVILRFM